MAPPSPPSGADPGARDHRSDDLPATVTGYDLDTQINRDLSPTGC
jgi:hypothetical protein